MNLRERFDDNILLELDHLTEEATLEGFLSYLLDRKKDYLLTWEDIKELCNYYYDKNYSESYYRKILQYRCTDNISINHSDDYCALDALAKEKIKLHEERVQINALIRKLAREETFKEIAMEAVKEMSSKKQLKAIQEENDFLDCYSNEAILQLSDWHFGIDCQNAWNTYNEEIAIARVSNLRDEVIYKAKANNVKIMHVLNLGDMIAGRIHWTIRLQSRSDVITQIMKVSELLCELLNDLSQYFEIHYYSCIDNHSRLDMNKAENLDNESLARITPWYIQNRLPHISVESNTYGEDIITFTTKGFKVLGIHGEKDKPDQVIDSLSRMTQDHYDLICMAHRHHFSCDEKNRTVVVANSSLMGTDDYAKNLRLSAYPSQNLIIVSDKNVMEVLYRITL